jgi:uncharacterized protein (DUF433 family)
MTTRHREHEQDERIARDPAVMVGKPVVRGTRVPVELVLRQLAQSLDVGDVLEAFPHLTPDDVRACLRYAARSVDIETRDSASASSPTSRAASA